MSANNSVRQKRSGGESTLVHGIVIIQDTNNW